jgi:hypothetical protein
MKIFNVMGRISKEREGVNFRGLILGGLFLAMAGFAGADQGASFKIITYDWEDERCAVEYESGMRAWVSLSDASEADRSYILAWAESNSPLAQKALQVSIAPQAGSSETVELEGGGIQVKTPHSYILYLEKQTDTPIEDLRVEYRYLISKEGAVTGNAAELSQVGGKLRVDDMAEGQALAFHTGEVLLTREFSSVSGDVPVSEERLLGVWVKLSGEDSGGAKVMRDICIPDTLKETMSWNRSASKLKAVSVDPAEFEQAFVAQKGAGASASEGAEQGIEVLRYTPQTKKFVILDASGERVKVSVDAVAGKDRDVLLAWLEENEDLTMERSLAVQVEAQVRQLTTNAVPAGVTMQKKREHSYLLSLKNITDLSIKGLRVEYRYFISATNSATGQDGTVETGVDTGSIMTNPPQMGGKLIVDDMEEGQTFIFNTGAVELSGEYKKAKVMDLFGSSYQDVALREEQVIGVWVKLSGSKSDGTLISQDVCVPRSLKQKVSWSDDVPMLTAIPVATPSAEEPAL